MLLIDGQRVACNGTSGLSWALAQRFPLFSISVAGDNYFGRAMRPPSPSWSAGPDEPAAPRRAQRRRPRRRGPEMKLAGAGANRRSSSRKPGKRHLGPPPGRVASGVPGDGSVTDIGGGHPLGVHL